MAGTDFLSGGPALALALSHAVVVVLLVIALFAARDGRGSLQVRLLGLLAVSLAALEAASGPAGDSIVEPVRTGLRLAGVVNVALLWLFCLSILRDDFRLRRAEIGGAALLILGPLLVVLRIEGGGAAPLLQAFSAIAPFAMIGHVAWIALSERAGDLVDGRRRARLWIPLALALAALTSVLSEELADATTASLVRNGVAGLPIALALLWWVSAFDPSRLRFETPAREVGDASQVDARDRVLLAELMALMTGERLYREPALSIDTLAGRLRTPTHRLRALINRGLGYRNFATFVNGYRLDHARAALGDPRRGRETILPIAFEAGFASLQTFNRVFRQTVGVTPTEYRARALAEAAQNEKSSLAS